MDGKDDGLRQQCDRRRRGKAHKGLRQQCMRAGMGEETAQVG